MCHYQQEDNNMRNMDATQTENPEALLTAAQEAQTAFWDALHELEEATGLEIDSTQDLQGWTLAALRKSADGDDEEDDEQEIPTCEACGCTDGTCQHAS